MRPSKTQYVDEERFAQHWAARVPFRVRHKGDPKSAPTGTVVNVWRRGMFVYFEFDNGNVANAIDFDIVDRSKKKNPGTRFYAASTSTEKKTRNPNSDDDEIELARELDAKLYFQGLAASDWERFQQDQKDGHYDAFDAKYYRERMNSALRWLADK